MVVFIQKRNIEIHQPKLIKEPDMFIVHVFVRVFEDHVENFKTATIENAQNSVKEPGVARFDVIREKDDPTKFILVEVYRAPEDAAKHKETDHYRKWRDTVASMMAEPRSSIKYTNVFPDENGWG
jgi:quinol monooxygenase YgiN